MFSESFYRICVLRGFLFRSSFVFAFVSFNSLSPCLSFHFLRVRSWSFSFSLGVRSHDILQHMHVLRMCAPSCSLTLSACISDICSAVVFHEWMPCFVPLSIFISYHLYLSFYHCFSFLCVFVVGRTPGWHFATHLRFTKLR